VTGSTRLGGKCARFGVREGCRMDDDAVQATEPLPYQVITCPWYAEAVFQVASVQLSVLLLRGVCPRCAALIDIPVLDPMLGGNRTATLEPGEDELDEDVAPLLCTCREAHPGRPDGVVGCGAYWNAGLPVVGEDTAGGRE